LLLKTTSFAASDLKLFAISITLIVLGSLGLTGGPNAAFANGADTVSVDGNTISWSFPAVEYTYTQNDMTLTNGHVLHFCAAENTSCLQSVRLVGFKMPATGQTSYTASTTDLIGSNPEDGQYALSEGTYRVQMVLWTAGVESTVGDLLTLVLTQSDQEPSTSTSTRSVPAHAVNPTPSISVSLLDRFSTSKVTFTGSGLDDVVAVAIDGQSLPLISVSESEVIVRLNKLKPGSYDVIFYSPTRNTTFPGGLTIIPALKAFTDAQILSSYGKNQSELSELSKTQIREALLSAPANSQVTVFGVAVREIIRASGNKLAKSRALSAAEFIQSLNPELEVIQKIKHQSETTVSPRGLILRFKQGN